MDGLFTEWTRWTACPVTCGGGKQQRDRVCVGPFFGGQDCVGDTAAVRKCSETPCPSNYCYSIQTIFTTPFTI